MPRAIPTLGYPTRVAAVVALSNRGMKPREIAALIGDGVTAGAIRVTLHHANAGRKGRGATERTVRVPVDLLNQLRIHADARGIAVNELIRRLLDLIADDDLVDSILDDQAEEA